LCGLRNETGGREHECTAKQRDREDGDEERSGGPSGTPEDEARQVRPPGTLVMPPATILEGSEDDPLIQVRRWFGCGESGEEADQPRRVAQLSCAPHARPQMLGEAMVFVVRQFTEQVCVDQRAC
jgi:hypothetical protein